MDCSPPGSSVHGIFQARILGWVAISYPRGSSWPRDWACNSCIGRRVLYHCATWVAPGGPLEGFKGSQSLSAVLKPAFHLPAMQLMSLPSGGGRREMDPSGSFPHSWRSWERTHSHFPIQEKPHAEEVSLGPELCHLGGSVMRLKSNSSSSKPILTYCSKSVLKMLHWKCRLPQRRSCLWVAVQDSTFQGLPHCSGAKPGPRSACPLANA